MKKILMVYHGSSTFEQIELFLKIFLFQFLIKIRHIFDNFEPFLVTLELAQIDHVFSLNLFGLYLNFKILVI
jgi:hypothetical protein